MLRTELSPLINLADRYMAPEIYREESYDKSIDVFSFAFIMQEVSLIRD